MKKIIITILTMAMLAGAATAWAAEAGNIAEMNEDDLARAVAKAKADKSVATGGIEILGMYQTERDGCQYVAVALGATGWEVALRVNNYRVCGDQVTRIEIDADWHKATREEGDDLYRTMQTLASKAIAEGTWVTGRRGKWDIIARPLTEWKPCHAEVAIVYKRGFVHVNRMSIPECKEVAK